MRTTLVEPVLPDDPARHLQLAPETDSDVRVLEKPINDGNALGFERHRDTMKLLHVQIPVVSVLHG